MAGSKAQKSLWEKKAVHNGNVVSNMAHVWLPPSQKFNIPTFHSSATAAVPSDATPHPRKVGKSNVNI